jgi:glycosyltransferase involved in cell wall biosynthesis
MVNPSGRGRLRLAVVARSVYPLHGVGGLERSVYDLVRHLAKEDADVILITKEPEPQQSDARIHERVRTVFVPYRTFPLAGRRGTTVIDRSTAYPLFGSRAGRAALQLVRDRQVDLVHGFGASVVGYARHRSSAGAPLVLNPQGLEEFGATDPSRARLKRALYLPLRRAVLTCARAADRIIATDRSLEPAVRAHLRVPADRIRTIPNGVDLESIDALSSADDGRRIKAAAGLGASDAVLLSVGRLERSKGFHVLIAALAALRSHAASPASEQWTWVLVGDGPYRGALERRIAQAGLRDRVILAGRVDDRSLHAWYEAATLFVHPTLYEGSSLATLEVMAHRRAVVATAAGGLPDKVRPGINGWLVEPGRPDALAAAISGALSRLPHLAAMGAESRRIVETEFAWPIVARKHLEMYRELVA